VNTPAATAPAPDSGLARCDACKGVPLGGAIPGVIAGINVVMCAWPTPCRERAQKIGIWKVYLRV